MTITGRTAVIAIVADPVAQARAPMLMNAALARRGRDAVLVPFHVAAADLPTIVAGLRAIRSLRGAIVSMPHKTALVDLLDEVTPEARQVGACNVVRREADGRLVGTMMDGDGFVAGLRGAGHEVRGKGPDPHGHDLVVNATSLGMQPGDALPLDLHRLEPGTVAAEVVIQPETTPFLAAAAARGCTVHPGQPMLAAQIDLMIDFIGA